MGLDILIEGHEEFVQDLVEDHGDRLRVQVSVGQEVVMTLETVGDGRTATTWGSHSRDKDDIFNLLEVFLLGFSVVPSLMVHPLADKLNRRLSEVLFSLRHVQIIDKDDIFLAGGRSENTLSTLLKLFIETILGLVGRGLSGESDGDHSVLFGHLRVEHVNEVDSLAGTGRSRGKNVLAVKDEQLLDVLHSD